MSAAEVARCLEPQERFEALRAHHLRRSGGKLVDLAYPNAEALIPGVREALAATLADLEGRDLQYTPYGGATTARRLAAHALERTHRLGLKHTDVVLTPGAMAALSVVLAAVREEDGDEALLVSPCWLDGPAYAWQQGLRPVLAKVHPDTGRLDPRSIERALSPRTRVVMLAQPSNPTGVLYTRDELEELAARLSSMPRPPLLIADECHRDFVFAPETFLSPAEVYPRTAIVYSIGKRLRMQGQRLGYVAFAPALRDEGWATRAIRLCRSLGHATPTALMQRALPRLLELEPHIDLVSDRRALAADMLQHAGYALMPGKHTMFVYARTPRPAEDDFAFADDAARAGVLVMPSSLFHEPGCFRITVTPSEETLARGLALLARMRGRRAA